MAEHQRIREIIYGISIDFCDFHLVNLTKALNGGGGGGSKVFSISTPKKQ